MPLNRFKQLAAIAEWAPEPMRTINDKEFHRKGGLKTVELHRSNGRLNQILELARKKNSIVLAAWHRKMKTQNPAEYYAIQYFRFKKVGKYKLRSVRGEWVRNDLEKQVADFLFEQKIEYAYEPCVKVANRCVFPDFVIGKKVVECTAWKGDSKKPSLERKIIELSKAGFEVVLVVPESLKAAYSGIGANVLMVTELCSFVMPK